MSASEPDSVTPVVPAEGAEASATEAASVASAAGAEGITTRCAGRTSVGLVREHNEDNFVVANLTTGQIRPRDEVFEDAIGDRGMMFAVCDGMGGAAAGEVASQMAVDILVEALRRGGRPKDRDALGRRLVSAVEEAGRRIFEAAQKERTRRGMGTTSTVGALIDKVLFLAEVGDSRAYLLRRGQLKQITKDQSLVNQLIEAGHLTEEEAEAFEHSNIILQALGTSESVQVDLTFVELRRGDRLMLCSDGLSGLVPLEMLRTTMDEIKDPSQCAAKLIEFAEAAGGHDNISVVISDFGGAALSEPVEGDNFGYLQYPLPPADPLEALAKAADEPIDDSKTPAKRSPRKSSPEENKSLASLESVGKVHVPRAAEVGDGRGNSLWIVGGLVALAAATFVWLTLEPVGPEPVPDEAHSVLPEPAKSHDGVAAAVPSAVVSQGQEIEVNVHTDVQSGTLVVNGEAKGALSAEQSRSLKLRPGAYRFEAQSAGSPVAVTVVTVRADADMPMDVFLQLPKGASDRTVEAPDPEVGDEPPPKPKAPPKPALEPKIISKPVPPVQPQPTKPASAPTQPKEIPANPF